MAALPPPAISLPLILGLINRSDAPTAIITSLLKEYKAYCTIQRALRTYFRKSRKTKEDQLLDNTITSTEATAQNVNVRHDSDYRCNGFYYNTCKMPIQLRRHWMWRAFLSPNLRIRRIAFRILLDYGSIDEKEERQRSENRRMCISILVELIDVTLRSCQSWYNGDDVQPSSLLVKPNDLEGGEPMVQYMSILHHLITTTRIRNSVPADNTVENADVLSEISSVCKSNTDKDEDPGQTKGGKTTASTFNNDKSNTSAAGFKFESFPMGVEDFVSSGGLRWIIRWMLHLTSILWLVE